MIKYLADKLHIKRKIIASAPSYEVYSQCTDLPIYNFVKCSVSGDLKYLVKSGSPDNLDEVWDKIKNEYAELCNDTSQAYLLNMVVKIDMLDKRLIIIQGIVDQLSKRRNEDLITMLQVELGFPFQYIDLETDLKNTITKAKFDLLTLKTLEAEYKAYLEENKGGKELTEQDYEEQMIMLSKWQQCKYTLRDTTVSEYVALINRFNAENKPKS
jgi:hypothetical protein